MFRGYAAVAVHCIKRESNAGGVIRAVQIYGASLVVFSGQRYQHQSTDTMKGIRSLPVIQASNVLECIPFDCVPIAVECVEWAGLLTSFEHPERAYYIFGPEDGTLPAAILSECKHVVKIPTVGPMNLAACVNVVLYDRLAKQLRNKAREPTST